MLSNKTVGIVGFGAIGQNVARMVKAFGCTVLYLKRTPLSAEEEAALGVQRATLAELLGASDVVTLNCPLTPETAGLIDAAALRSMKPTAILVNVAPGGVVVESDLVEALRARPVVTPHLAAIASDNFAKTVGQMFGNIARVMRGEPVPEVDRVV
jgi:D-3-phosphoglycerate dehydrogenase